MSDIEAPAPAPAAAPTRVTAFGGVIDDLVTELGPYVLIAAGAFMLAARLDKDAAYQVMGLGLLILNPNRVTK